MIASLIFQPPVLLLVLPIFLLLNILRIYCTFSVLLLAYSYSPRAKITAKFTSFQPFRMSRATTSSKAPPKGSAEYLSMCLQGPDHSCPHPKKLKAGIESKIPSRLGFFHVSDEDMSYLDTEKLCRECYDDVVPDGFLAWPAYYQKAEAVNPYVDQPRYHSGQPTGGDPRYFPLQLQAGTEKFGSPPDDPPQSVHSYPAASRSKAFERVGMLNYDGKHYEKRTPQIPPNAETVEAWRFLQWAKMPFYIDILHLYPPWRPGLPKREQDKENTRVARSNGAAYLGATWVINAVPEGGYGPYTASEHRIAEAGSYRLVPLGQFKHHPAGLSEPETASISSSRRNSLTIQVSQSSSCLEEIIPRRARH